MDKALLLLLEKKDYEFITVKEICETAEVNRSTFYLHYENVSDLLSETIEYCNAEFLACFDSNAATTIEKIRRGKKEELVFVTPGYLIPYLRFVKENQRLFLAAAAKSEVYGSEEKYQKMYKHLFEPIMERFGFSKEERKFVSAFYINGIMAIVTEWIKGDCSEEICDISNIITKLVLQNGEVNRS